MTSVPASRSVLIPFAPGVGSFMAMTTRRTLARIRASVQVGVQGSSVTYTVVPSALTSPNASRFGKKVRQSFHTSLDR